ncbi:hypothetical protein CAPTEDRAFT_183074 [Capitella teleta]|uniref:Uncharacterized protein n=1 Tax=Capitella teleta TaxID=283909 RepID=R7UUD7_CAPTE|nr:hypothetical protein CAPTEDRAFT_183074 [Capitella teleta]|eukprot:ELU10228.1 hypothetical protein CAPTEDRAFT_183074 [Capitella teleta]
MAGIPYMVDFSSGFSSKGKIPWITLNDERVADSQFSMDFIREKFNVRSFNQQLTAEQNATARALRKMAEEELYWTMCSVTFGDDLSELERLLPYSGIKRFITPRLLRFFIWRQMRGHGIGRHTPAEILSIAHADLNALSDYLGLKPFFFGDEPSEEDSALFGVLAQIKWHMNGSPHQTWLTDEFCNLNAYCDRMKEKFWPDWLKRTSESDVIKTQTKIFGANSKGIDVKLDWK